MQRRHAKQESQAEEPRELGLWERWTTDWDGEPIVEFDGEAHSRWCEQWAPKCPIGNQRVVRRPLGFWERNVCQLELRVAIGSNENGVCDVIVDEHDDEVHVRVLLCYDPDDDESFARQREYVDCPVRVWLDRPLGQRAVIDVDSDEELPIYTPAFLDNVPQSDHGYRPANRRPPGTVPRPPGYLSG
jgi:hypothetical protein